MSVFGLGNDTAVQAFGILTVNPRPVIAAPLPVVTAPLPVVTAPLPVVTVIGGALRRFDSRSAARHSPTSPAAAYTIRRLFMPASPRVPSAYPMIEPTSSVRIARVSHQRAWPLVDAPA